MYVFTYTDAPAEASGSGTESWTLDAVQVLVLGMVQQTYYCADFSKGSTEGKPRLSCNCKIVRERGPPPRSLVFRLNWLARGHGVESACHKFLHSQCLSFPTSVSSFVSFLCEGLVSVDTGMVNVDHHPHTVFVLLHRIPIPTPLPPLPIRTLEKSSPNVFLPL